MTKNSIFFFFSNSFILSLYSSIKTLSSNFPKLEKNNVLSSEINHYRGKKDPCVNMRTDSYEIYKTLNYDKYFTLSVITLRLLLIIIYYVYY